MSYKSEQDAIKQRFLTYNSATAQENKNEQVPNILGRQAQASQEDP
jgi:hypothetical protein